MTAKLFRNGWGVSVKIGDINLPIYDGSIRQGVITTNILKLTVEQFGEYQEARKHYEPILPALKYIETFDSQLYKENPANFKEIPSDVLETFLELDIFTPEEKEEIAHDLYQRKIKYNSLPQPNRPSATYIYLMRDEANNAVKIGYSYKPQRREKTLQSEKPTIVLINAWEGTPSEESFLHNKFADKRMRGEWFSLSDQDMEEISQMFAGRKTYSEK